MPLYQYTAFDALGKKKRGVVEALSQKAAGRKLRGQGLFPTDLALSRSAEVSSGQRFVLRRVSAMQLGVATRQLSTMLAAGMPLDEAEMMLCMAPIPTR